MRHWAALVGLWGGFATALCQGLGWFKRLALIGLLGVGLRLGFGWVIVLKFPVAEWAVLASGIAVLANLILLFGKKDLTRPADPGFAVKPRTRPVFHRRGGVRGWRIFFLQGDLLVVQRYFSQHHFSQAELDAYTSVGVFARALPMTVTPLLIVLFTHRSAAHTGDALRKQLKLIGLYAGGLFCGAIGLLVLRTFCLTLIGRNTPEAAAMIGPLALTMVFVALL